MTTTDGGMNKVAAAGAEWDAWLGATEARTELISAERVAGFAATLDLDTAPEPGSPLPPGWQWLFFNAMVRRRELGPDGHPKRGGFLPPVPLPRRMWAGGRIEYASALTIGMPAVRVSKITKIESKLGREGQLVFVTVGHTISCDGVACIHEEQDIVFRGAARTGGTTPAQTSAPTNAEWKQEVQTDSTLLFRYSALTSNGHRIHYDETYARQEEGYPALVVHGPLTATLLQNFALRCFPEQRLVRFEFRGVHPLFVTAPFTLEAVAKTEPRTLSLWARGPDGELAMRASAVFSS
jgi:3-methylfumaryl-CoA hydratase